MNEQALVSLWAALTTVAAAFLWLESNRFGSGFPCSRREFRDRLRAESAGCWRIYDSRRLCRATRRCLSL